MSPGRLVGNTIILVSVNLQPAIICDDWVIVYFLLFLVFSVSFLMEIYHLKQEYKIFWLPEWHSFLARIEQFIVIYENGVVRA